MSQDKTSLVLSTWWRFCRAIAFTDNMPTVVLKEWQRGSQQTVYVNDVPYVIFVEEGFIRVLYATARGTNGWGRPWLGTEEERIPCGKRTNSHSVASTFHHILTTAAKHHAENLRRAEEKAAKERAIMAALPDRSSYYLDEVDAVTGKVRIKLGGWLTPAQVTAIVDIVAAKP